MHSFSTGFPEPTCSVAVLVKVMRGPTGVKPTSPQVLVVAVVKGEMGVKGNHIYLDNVNFSPGTPNWNSPSGVRGTGMAEALQKISLKTWFEDRSRSVGAEKQTCKVASSEL